MLGIFRVRRHRFGKSGSELAGLRPPTWRGVNAEALRNVAIGQPDPSDQAGVQGQTRWLTASAAFGTPSTPIAIPAVPRWQPAGIREIPAVTCRSNKIVCRLFSKLCK